MKRYLGPVVLTLILCCCASASAQSSAVAPCPDSGFNGKLACMLPDIYGRSTAQGALSGSGDFGNPRHVGHFDNGLAASLGAINGDISQQLGLLPLASPGSGFSLTFDLALKTFVTSTDSLGPILSERADTVGKHRLAIGVSYQFFQFDKIDGVTLSNIPAVYVHNSEPSTQGPPGITCSPSTTTSNPDQNLAAFTFVPANNPQQAPPGSQIGDCSFVRDRFETQNNIKVHLHQITTYLTFGVTRNLDVSVVIPYVDVLFGVSSQANIATGTYYADHIFSKGNDGNACPLDNLATPASITTAQNVDCFQHNFPDNGLSTGSGPASSSAKGIGDVTVRVKDMIWRGERLGIAAGLDVRFPTGDALNYLGSGAYGVKPFVIASYHARVAPHAMVGFQANGSTVTGIGGDLIGTTGTRGQLPNEFVYDVGADAYATKRLTAAFDIIGQRVFHTESLVVNNDQYLAPCFNLNFTTNPMYYNQASPNPPASCDVFRQPIAGSGPVQYNYFNIDNSKYVASTVTRPNLDTNSGVSTNITNASMGVKIALVKRLVLSLNVLVRLDNGGLHSKAAPMAALGYTF
jgi:hypothetical protein